MEWEGGAVEHSVADQFTLDDRQSLALTLAKLNLAETDLESDPDHEDRVVKREVIRRYTSLLFDQLGVSAPSEQANELGWRDARRLAADVAERRDGVLSVDAITEALRGVGSDTVRYVLTSPELAGAALKALGQRRGAVVLMIELAAFFPWPQETKWESKVRTAAVGDLVDRIPASVDRQLMDEIDADLGRAVRRLSRKEANKKLLAALTLGGAVAGLLTGGLAAPLIGSALGGAMGLSGAAATSAGLALLGGGAVSAGGLGMAGGTALVAGSMGVGAAGIGAAGGWLRGAQPNDVVVEAAKLEIFVKHALVDEKDADAIRRMIIERVQVQIGGLVEEINHLTAIVREQHRVVLERDELRKRLDEEREKRQVLERALQELRRYQREMRANGGG